MATPRTSTYSVAAGAGVYAGIAEALSPLAAAAAAMSVGEWRVLATEGLSTSLFFTNGQNTLGYLDKGNYSPLAKQIRFIGQGHYQDQRWHQYDEATNTWSNLADPPWDTGGDTHPGYIGHGYQHNTVDPATGDWYYRQFNNNTPRRYIRATDTWVELPASAAAGIAGGLAWLPSIGTQGGLILHSDTTVQRWDKATNTWTQIATGLSASGGYHNVALYSPPHNVVLSGGGNGSTALWKTGPTGAPVACSACQVPFGIGNSITTVDPVSGDMLVIRTSDAHKYSVAGDNWSSMSLGGAPSFGTIDPGGHIVATPIAAYGVIMFLFGNSPAVYLYKHT